MGRGVPGFKCNDINFDAIAMYPTQTAKYMVWCPPMSTPKRTVFFRNSIDHVTDELVIALSGGEAIEFKALFAIVFEGLKRKNAVSGGEEMLRLRCYEKLLKLSGAGLVQKSNKTYRGLEGLDQASSVNRLARAQDAYVARTAAAELAASAAN